MHLLSGFLACLIIFLISSVLGEEECLKKKIWCYDCSTENNPECGDPSNFSLTRTQQRNDFLTQCEGCCVKIIKKKGTPQQVIQRTCTGKLQINLFMVDHVCMDESDGRGIMCFCESDGCNSSPLTTYPFSLLIGFAIIICIVFNYFSPF